MDNRVWVKDAVMTIRLPEEVDHFVADRLREEGGDFGGEECEGGGV